MFTSNADGNIPKFLDARETMAFNSSANSSIGEYNINSIGSASGFTLPANTGIQYAEIIYNLSANTTGAGGKIIGQIKKNGTAITTEVVDANDSLSTLGNTSIHLSTGIIPVSANDAFTFEYGAQNNNTMTLDSSNTYIQFHATVTGTTAQGPQGNAGVDGTDGTDGVGITSVSLVGSNLTLTYSNTSTQDVGNIQGPTGPTGPAGADGDVDQTLSLSGNTITISGNDDTVDLTSIAFTDARFDARLQTRNIGNLADVDTSGASNGQVLAWSSSNSNWEPLTLTDNDAQDLSLSGNVISLTNQSGNVDLTSLLGSAGGGISNIVEDTSPQLGGALDVNGQDIVTTSNGDIDLDPNGSGVVVFKGNATKGSGQFKLNCENNSHGITIKGPPHSAAADYTLTLPNNDGDADQVLKTDGSGNLSWADQTAGLSNTGVTAGTYGSSTQSARITVDAQGRITGVTTQNISGGGGGGSGTSYEYFKLHYTSGGAIDTAQGTGGISNISSNIGNVTVNNSASNSCEIIVDFGGNYNYPPLGITAYGFSQSTSEYNIKGMIQSAINTTLKLDGSGDPHGSLSTANITMSLTRSETGSSSGFGQSSHAWIYFTMGG